MARTSSHRPDTMWLRATTDLNSTPMQPRRVRSAHHRPFLHNIIIIITRRANKGTPRILQLSVGETHPSRDGAGVNCARTVSLPARFRPSGAHGFMILPHRHPLYPAQHGTNGTHTHILSVWTSSVHVRGLLRICVHQQFSFGSLWSSQSASDRSKDGDVVQ